MNYASLDIINPFSGHHHFQCHLMKTLPSQIVEGRKYVSDQIFDSGDVLELPVEVLEDRPVIPLSYGKVWLYVYPMQSHMVLMY
jgi:hypothetical protein